LKGAAILIVPFRAVNAKVSGFSRGLLGISIYLVSGAVVDLSEPGLFTEPFTTEA
jgi:hypothetical protein